MSYTIEISEEQRLILLDLLVHNPVDQEGALLRDCIAELPDAEEEEPGVIHSFIV